MRSDEISSVNLILFIDSLQIGGTQRQILVMASGIAERGFEVRLLTVFPGGRFWDDASERPDIRLDSLFSSRPKHKLGRMAGFFFAPFRLRRYLHRKRPDIIYSMLDVANLTARLATMGSGNRPTLVWGIRASARQSGSRAAIAQWLCGLLSAGVPFVIANSANGLTAHRDMGFRVQQGTVVHNGFDTDRFYFDAEGRQLVRSKWGVHDDEILIGLVGRVDPMKGHDIFLRAAASLRGWNTELRFVCVGPGTAEAKTWLSELAQKNQLGDRMIIVDGEEDMKLAFCALDIVVSASVAEGFPNVIGEAMACERTCVVTDVGDAAELVGDCGILVCANDEQELAAAVRSAVSQRDEMGERGRERIIKEFSIEAMSEKTQRMLEAAVAR